VPRPARRRPAPRPPAATAPPEPTPRSRARAVLALGALILVAAHGLLYLFLSADARSDMTRIEAAWTPADLAAARDPGAPPHAGTPAYGPWLKRTQRWEAARVHDLDARLDDMLGGGMLVSLLVGLVLLVRGARAAAAAQRRAARPRRVRIAPRPRLVASQGRAPARPVAPVRVRRSA
jgi:hypothetical protein